MRSIISLLLQLLLAFAFSLLHVPAQNPPGFVSLDCGLRGSKGYNDSTTGLYYTNDDAYVETGEGRSISPDLKTNSIEPQFFNVRSFPGRVGSRSCYTLRPLYGKGKRILLRVAFMYGNYDAENKPPEFDLHLGVGYWATVIVSDASLVYRAEILHIPTADYLYLCLVNTGRGTPFISLIEMRSVDPSRPIYNKIASESLMLFTRVDLGSSSRNSFRYNEGDPYDRIWSSPLSVTNKITLSTNETIFTNAFQIPPSVMRTADEAVNTSDSITITIYPTSHSDQFYAYLHFAELVPNQSSRGINIYIDGVIWIDSFVPQYLSVTTIFHPDPAYFNVIKINTSSNSNLPAFVNAFEVYQVQKFLYYETDENDVYAITSIKAAYAITKNWQGDPCSPQDFTWTGINCSYSAFDPPNIISLNLSSSQSVGTITPHISNLTKLQSLDLSYNNIRGHVPDFLSSLPSLRYLYLEGNNFTGPLPPVLLEKSRNGSLILSLGTNNGKDLCANDTCKKKKSNYTTVPIVASVVGILAILIILSTLLYMILRRKKQAGTFLVPHVRQFTFSEVTSMIRGKKVLGKGAFGNVHLGSFRGVEVAVKILMEFREQARDFQYEVRILAKVHHTNLTRILGYCDEGTHKAIIIELMQNGNLERHLLGSNSNVLSWERRLSIMIGAAQGLEYLHHGCNPPIIHRDIKPANILLTSEFEAKLADFGVSRIFPAQTNRVIGTPGYRDPQYDDPSMLTEKVDVYSFGVVMLVIVTGKAAALPGQTHITQWVSPKLKNRDIRGIVDRRLQAESYDVNAARRVLELAMECVSTNISSRPDMHRVVKQVKEATVAAKGTRDSTVATPHTA